MLTDAFLPFVNSASVQLNDLTVEFIKFGHVIDVVTPKHPVILDKETSRLDGLNVMRFKSLNTKSPNRFIRFFSELVMPVMALRHFRKIILGTNYDLIIWYSPSIFWGPLVRLLKAKHKCPTYLILRDIFPEWANELGIIKNKAIYYFLKFVANYQYEVADHIGIQSESNQTYFEGHPRLQAKIKVLNNWLSDKPTKTSKITKKIHDINATHKFVYTGNLGIAQGLEIFSELAKQLCHSNDYAFIFIGSGSFQGKLKRYKIKHDLQNLHIFDRVPENELGSIFKICDYGIVALSTKHQSHNIPGKFVAYVKSSLPVIAVINANNDLVNIIKNYGVGVVSCSDDIDDLKAAISQITQSRKEGATFTTNCQKLFDEKFKTSAAVKQIMSCTDA